MNDEEGDWIYFSRIKPEEDAKKKGGDDLTNIYARAWLDFTPMLTPGALVTN